MPSFSSPMTLPLRIAGPMAVVVVIASWIVGYGGPMLVAATAVALLFAVSTVPLTYAHLQDEVLDLRRLGVEVAAPLHHIHGVEPAGWLGNRVRVHFPTHSALGRSVVILVPFHGNPLLPNPHLVTLRDQVWRSHRKAGATKALAEHRWAHEAPSREPQRSTHLLEQIRAAKAALAPLPPR